MKKFFAMFCIPVSRLEEWESQTKSEQQQADEEKMMSDWNAWMEKHKVAMVGDSHPLGSNKRVSPGKISDTRNEMAYYCIIQAESHDVAAKLFADNPHLQIPDAYIEVMEIVEMG